MSTSATLTKTSSGDERAFGCTDALVEGTTGAQQEPAVDSPDGDRSRAPPVGRATGPRHTLGRSRPDQTFPERCPHVGTPAVKDQPNVHQGVNKISQGLPAVLPWRALCPASAILPRETAVRTTRGSPRRLPSAGGRSHTAPSAIKAVVANRPTRPSCSRMASSLCSAPNDHFLAATTGRTSYCAAEAFTHSSSCLSRVRGNGILPDVRPIRSRILAIQNLNSSREAIWCR